MSRKGKDSQGESFYAPAMTEAERMELASAREMEGVDEEIAVLRTRLRSMVRQHPTRYEMLMKGFGALSRMTALRYRMSDESKEDLEASIEGVLNSVGRAMGLGEFGGTDER